MSSFAARFLPVEEWAGHAQSGVFSVPGMGKNRQFTVNVNVVDVVIFELELSLPVTVMVYVPVPVAALVTVTVAEPVAEL